LILSSGLEVSKPISNLLSFLTGSPFRALDLKVGAAGSWFGYHFFII
jgi:hypothetical protein